MEYFVGLMSGTSMDGVDGVVCAFEGTTFRGVQAHAATAYPPELRGRLLRLQRESPALTLRELAQLDRAVARAFADTALATMAAAALPASSIQAIGSHGQTVFHDPVTVGSSLQLGDPNAIAQATGVTTVADFRRADIALGGHGAPLVPAFHQALLASAELPRAVVNIGGIANVTLLADEHSHTVCGFDTGPGNGLMDEWAEQHLRQPYDAGGEFAGRGRLQLPLLEALLEEPYFAAPPPKSTGRGEFNLDWLQRRYPALQLLEAADVQRTLCELTAYTISEAILRHGPGTHEVLVCGGGIKNQPLMRRLGELLGSMRLRSIAEAGIDPQQVEAAAFAWLAMRAIKGLPGNLPAVTGASRPAVLGGIYRA